jgi:signal transduction histidine kinase
MQPVTITWLKQIETLSTVPDNQLQWLIEHSEHYVLNDGDHLFSRDEALAGTFFIVSGIIRIYLTLNGVRNERITMQEHDITGFLPYSRGKIAFADGIAAGPTQIMMLPVDKITELIRQHYELTQALVSVMSNRVRDATAFVQQNEKMMALGKLSAGLAHELNNPAAAIVRNAASLQKHLQNQPQLFAQLLAVKMDGSKIQEVKEEIARIKESKTNTRLSLRERNMQESDLAEWLDDHDIADADELAANFVEHGFKTSDLDDIYLCMTPDAAPPVLSWIHDTLLSEKMVADIHEASQRIAGLISSIKTFTHMDRGQDRQYAQLETGIQNTLTMLGHKLRANQITVTEHYDASLPPVKILVGELNQVWTNLIDNAVDAMEVNGKGNLTITTRKDGECAEIIISDDGPGIPDDIKNRIFDPFFTTKEMGKGTGMGLEVVQRIIRQQHLGSIKVESQPGKTDFIISIPIHAA